MLNTKQKRLAFVLYVSMVLILMGILFTYNGMDSPWPWMCVSFFVIAPMFYIKLVKLPYMMWKESYTVGVAEIDYDHKKLVELINKVVSASSYKMGDDYSQKIFDKLISYTKYHLAREESLMAEYDYPDRKNHIIQHRKFIEKVDYFCSNLGTGGKTSYPEIFDFLKNWLIKHICKTDKKLGIFIQAKRAEAFDAQERLAYASNLKEKEANSSNILEKQTVTSE